MQSPLRHELIVKNTGKYIFDELDNQGLIGYNFIKRNKVTYKETYINKRF